MHRSNEADNVTDKRNDLRQNLYKQNRKKLKDSS